MVLRVAYMFSICHSKSATAMADIMGFQCSAVCCRAEAAVHAGIAAPAGRLRVYECGCLPRSVSPPGAAVCFIHEDSPI